MDSPRPEPSVVRDSSPRTNRSMSRSAGMLRGWREMFLMDRTTLPSQRHTSTDAGALQGVLVAVGEQVVDDPPQVAAVGQDGALLLREGGHHGEAALGKFLLKLPQGLLDELDWYVDYYSHASDYEHNGLPYQQRETERYILAEPFRPGEDIYGTAGQRLTRLRHSPPFEKAHFLRQTGYLLDFQALLRGSIVPTHYFVYLRERPAAEHPGLMTLPAGNWLCMQSRILAEPFPGPELKRYFRDQETPRLVVANEYEDNFRSFRNCIYEVQIFQHS